LKRNIITTGDGSKTIQIEDWNEQYHSIHGAVNEANHVFIKNGLLFYKDSIWVSGNTITILEMGFGTGLNALLTLDVAKQFNLTIDYVGVEAYPVSTDELKALDYDTIITSKVIDNFGLLHQTTWKSFNDITPNFRLQKQKKKFHTIADHAMYDIIYFDAFGARVQPELWTEAIFQNMYNALKPNSILVTYSAKGSVRRAMQAVGFTVERLPGPPGKREMLRARKEA